MDTTSRDEILLLKSQCSELSLSSKSGLFSDTYLQTTFAGFFISNIFNPIVAFSFGLSTYFNASDFVPYHTNIPYDIINIDTHNGWNRSSNVYNVPVAGVYVISLTLAAFAYSKIFTPLQINNEVVAGLYFSSNNSNGIETFSRTVLISLNKGDILAATVDRREGPVYSDIYCQTRIKGFQYNSHQHLLISWFVALESKDKDFLITGPKDPLQFNVVLVNQGYGWNNQSNKFITPVPGVYYIQLTAGICRGRPTKMELLINGLPIVNVYRQLTSHNGWDIRSRAVIWRLQQGDELRVRLPADYHICYNWNRYTAFGGFRLYS